MIDVARPRPSEAPRHEDLVDERLVVGYFLAALGYPGDLDARRPADGPATGALESAERHRAALARPLADGPHQRHRLRLSGQRVSGRAALGRAAADAAAGAQTAGLSCFIFVAWQVVVLGTAVGIVLGRRCKPRGRAGQPAVLAGRRAWNGAKRRSGSIPSRWPDCCSWPSTSWRRSSARQGPLYVTLWYFMAAFVWTFLTYAMGNFLPQYCARRHQRRRRRRAVHSRPGRPVRHAARLGPDVLLRADPAQEADLEPRPVAGRLLGAGVLLSAQRHSPLSLHADPDVPAIRGGHLDDRRRVGRDDGDHQLLRHDLGLGPRSWSPTCRSAGSTPAWSSTVITCLQCALQATLTFQALIHFTDWVVGHAHLVMFGVFSLWLFGIMTYLFPAAAGAPSGTAASLCEWHYWLSAVGLFVMFVDLTLAGVFQGYYWALAAAVGRLGRRLAAVLDRARLRRPGDDRRPALLLLQPLS